MHVQGPDLNQPAMRPIWWRGSGPENENSRNSTGPLLKNEKINGAGRKNRGGMRMEKGGEAKTQRRRSAVRRRKRRSERESGRGGRVVKG